MIIGLDLSLNHTGVATIVGDVERWEMIEPPKKTVGVERLDFMERQLSAFLVARRNEVAAVVVEDYAFGAKGQVYQIGELGGAVRLALYRMRIRTWTVTPGTLKKFVCSKGNAKKDEMLLATYKRFGLTFTNDNLSDAVGLAFMGCALENKKNARLGNLSKAQAETIRVAELIVKGTPLVARSRTKI